MPPGLSGGRRSNQAARAYLFPAASPATGLALWLVIVLAITGMLFVIPTAGEVPMMQTFMGFGLGAAGAGVLMMTLPTISLPSLAMVSRAVPVQVLAGLVTAVLAATFGL